MRTLPRRRRGGYFPPVPGAPSSVEIRVERRVAFSEADPMGILWHGCYSSYFEQANEALGRHCGLTYDAFIEHRLGAPVVQFHVDYFSSPTLGEKVAIKARFIWSEGARLNIEYKILRMDNTLAATGYTVQMLISAETGEPLLVSPPLLEECRHKWRAGKFNGEK